MRHQGLKHYLDFANTVINTHCRIPVVDVIDAYAIIG